MGFYYNREAHLFLTHCVAQYTFCDTICYIKLYLTLNHCPAYFKKLQ